ncbi:MAG: Na/Pi cotransporter family protein [Mycoplasmatales bacterium]
MADFFTQENIFLLIGGLGIFLYGIKLMGDSLKELAGENLKVLINKYTTNKYMAILTGVFATVLIQSSSGTTALTISLVRAGLMDLGQAIGVIMGSNIGTTVTAFLLGLSIKDYALLIIFIGALIYMFSHKKKKNLIGRIVFGFGLLFYGMTLMETPLKALSDTPQFTVLMRDVAQNPLLGILIGALLTMIVQSSSATIGILQGLYLTGAVPFSIAFSILLGDNIGTTVTSWLASIGGSRDSQRAALAHLLFNIFGSVLFFTLMFGFGFIDHFQTFIASITDNKVLQIAFTHFLFNVTVTLLLVGFIKQFEALVKKIIPRSSKEMNIDLKDMVLENGLIETAPVMALEQVENNLTYFAEILISQIENARDYINTADDKYKSHVHQLEVATNSMDKQLQIFLRDLSLSNIDEVSSRRALGYLYSTSDFESIGDLAVNVVTKIEPIHESKNKLTKEAKIELTKMLELNIDALNNLIDLFKSHDDYLCGIILEKEKQLDILERKYTKRHLSRVKEKECQGKIQSIYIDILSDIERMGDHLEDVVNNYLNTDNILDEEDIVDVQKIVEEVKED